jgi:hypothetical protein
MEDLQITWRGLVLGGDTDIDVHKITGWDDLDDPRSYDQPRARGHGDHPGDLYGQARIVTVTGEIASRTSRDALAADILAASPLSSTVEDLMITTFGRTLAAGARLIRRHLPVEEDYASGKVPFALAWRCPDPLRYGQLRTAPTGLPTAGGGLSYPIGDLYDYGPLGATGQITLPNEGTAPAPIVFEVTGSLPEGFEISAAGGRLRYPAAVPAGQVIVFDTADGTVLVEGTADRRGELTAADWLQIPPGTALTVQFTSLGGAYDPNARLVAAAAPAYW